VARARRSRDQTGDGEPIGTRTVQPAVAAVFREEAGRLTAWLVRGVGDFELAADVVQETILSALERWPGDDAEGDQRRRSRDASALIERAAALRRPGPYQLQAAIAACHAEARSWSETDWRQIVILYDMLLAIEPSAVARLNRAVAHAAQERALALTSNRAEQSLLRRRLRDRTC
jgi:predicted RNA polymerase sigma factor